MKRGGGGGRRGGGGGGKIRFEAVEDEEEEANDAMAMDGGEEDDGDERMELDSSEEGAIDNEVSENRGGKALRLRLTREEEFDSEWEFFPFGEGDWHAVKQHCSRLLDGRAWDVGSLATLVTETQRHVGSAIKIGERTSEALGIGAVVNLRTHEAPGLRAVAQFAAGRFEGAERQRVEAMLAERAVGLLLNERLLNLPPLVALQLHLALFEEMAEARRRAGGGGEYALDYLLLITVAFRESAGDKSAHGAAKKARERAGQLEWFRPEEEVYMQHAAASAVWPVAVQDQASRWTFDGRIAQFKVVMFVPTTAIPAMAARFEAINNGEYDKAE
jgi:hypothetical protein